MSGGPVMVAVFAQETARYSFFSKALTDLQAPPGSEVRWRFGWNLAESHNALIEEFLAGDFEWLWWMGDDHSFSPDVLQRLLARDLDLVLPVCLMRTPPYRPVAFTSDGADTSEAVRLDLSAYPDGGLVEVEATGDAGLLVRRSVFEAIERPWFEAGGGIEARVGEDVNFCRKARAAGFKIFVDLDVVLGHCLSATVWPVREADGWTFAFSTLGGFSVTLPPGFQAYADEVGR